MKLNLFASTQAVGNKQRNFTAKTTQMQPSACEQRHDLK